MEMSFKLAQFNFVNYVRFEGMDEAFSVGKLSDEQAGQYWDDIKDAWIKHVRERRELDRTNDTRFK